MSTEKIIVLDEESMFEVEEVSAAGKTVRTSSSDNSHRDIVWRFERSNDVRIPNSVTIRNNGGQSIKVKFRLSHEWLYSSNFPIKTLGGKERTVELPLKVSGICLPAESKYL